MASPNHQRSGQKRTTTRAHARGKSAVRKSDLQEKAFYLSVEGRTCREIAAELGIDKSTVSRYVRAEEKLRGEELAGRREAEKARRIAHLQRLSALALSRSSIPGSGALSAVARIEEMINRILGVDAPTKLDVGLQELWDAIDIPDEE